MPLIQIPVGIAPCHIDDFPKEVGEGKEARPFERSCKGALHLRPASTKVLSQDELDWLKAGKGKAKRYAKLARRLTVVRVDVVPDKSDRPHAEPLKPAVKPSKPEAPNPKPTSPPAASTFSAPTADDKPKDEGDKKRKKDR